MNIIQKGGSLYYKKDLKNTVLIDGVRYLEDKDNKGFPFEDMISKENIPIENVILLDTKPYDIINIYTHVYQYKHYFVPHTRRTLEQHEIQQIKKHYDDLKYINIFETYKKHIKNKSTSFNILERLDNKLNILSRTIPIDYNGVKILSIYNTSIPECKSKVCYLKVNDLSKLQGMIYSRYKEHNFIHVYDRLFKYLINYRENMLDKDKLMQLKQHFETILTDIKQRNVNSHLINSDETLKKLHNAETLLYVKCNDTYRCFIKDTEIKQLINKIEEIINRINMGFY